MDPGRPSALAYCAVRAPFGDNAAVPFPWLRSSPWPRRRLMAAEESRGGYEEAQAMAARTSERMGIAQGSRPLRRQVPIGTALQR